VKGDFDIRPDYGLISEADRAFFAEGGITPCVIEPIVEETKAITIYDGGYKQIESKNEFLKRINEQLKRNGDFPRSPFGAK
jgi:hypothetical protein